MSKTLQSFRQWATTHSPVANPTLNVSNKYTGECVSLIQQYLNQVFGVPYAPRGHARDFVPPNFTRVTNGTRWPGDIVRYGRSYGGGYGHIGLIDDEGKFLDQNGVYARRVGRRDAPFNYIEAVFRPNAPFTIKDTIHPPATDNSILGARGYLTRGDVGENVRKVNAFFRSTFPAYAPPNIIGNQFGPITQNTVKEFQRRANVGGGIDGNIGPLTYKAMQNHGFKY